MTSPVVAATRLSRSQWIVLALLVVSVFINYVDRGNLSVAAPQIQTELNLNPEQLGLLLSAFFWTYAAFQLFGIAGWLVDRFNVCLVFAAGYFLWSGATAVTGVMQSFLTIFILRLLLGMGESIAYPAYSKILAGYYPEHHRGIANSLIDAGSKLGPALGTLTGGLLVARFGWRVFFIALGLISLLWLLPWARWAPRGSGLGASHPRDGASVRQILRQRSAWGTFAGLFCANYFWYFLLTWLPLYLVRERHFSMDRMATFGALCYLMIAVTTVTAGWISDRWVTAGGSLTRVRKTMTAGGLFFSTVILPVAAVDDLRVGMVLLVLACMSFGVFTSSHWAITQTLAGPLAAGKWTGIQNGVGNLAGVVAPWLTGFVVQRAGSFFWAFAAAAAVALAGAAVFLFWIGPIRPVDWDARS